MSTANRMSGRRRQAGFTFIEVVIALALITMMALVVERTLAATQDAHKYLDCTRRVKERCEKVSYEVYEAISSSRRVYGRDATGEGYRQALDLSGLPPIPGTRLPLPDETRDMGPDLPGEPRTGNMLLFVRESDPVSCLANALTGEVRYIDIHRFACFYPHQTDRHIISADARDAVDLVLWYSLGYPSHPQLTAIADDDDRRQVVLFLYDAGYRHAWDPDGPVGETFYALQSTGLIDPSPVPDPTIEESPDVSQHGRVVYSNAQLARTVPTSAARRGIFTLDAPEDWVPEGFELKVTGSSGHRKVWLHVVVEGESARSREAVHSTTLIASVRDF